jgi:hypothetical protein
MVTGLFGKLACWAKAGKHSAATDSMNTEDFRNFKGISEMI